METPDIEEIIKTYHEESWLRQSDVEMLAKHVQNCNCRDCREVRELSESLVATKKEETNLFAFDTTGKYPNVLRLAVELRVLLFVAQ